MSPGNPPWYERDENGKIMVLEVPAGLKTHPEIIRRGLELEPIFSCKIVRYRSLVCVPLCTGIVFTKGLQGVVYKTCWFKEPVYYIKIVDTDTEEAAVFQRLSRCREEPHHSRRADAS